MRRFLFRLDMAKENEQFLALRQGRGVDQVYSGTPMKVGPGWIPDFFELAIDRDANVLSLTLIELEATDIVARASCRNPHPKFLTFSSVTWIQSSRSVVRPPTRASTISGI